MKYFKLHSAHEPWLRAEIAKGTIFYDMHNGFRGIEGRRMISTAAYRESGRSYDDMPVREVVRLIKLYKNVYWRN